MWVFDILAHSGKDLRPLSLSARRMKLNQLMARVHTPMFRCSETFLDPHALFKACSDRRMEGIVSKRVDRPYQSGTSQDWIKIKCPEWRGHVCTQCLPRDRARPSPLRSGNTDRWARLLPSCGRRTFVPFVRFANQHLCSHARSLAHAFRGIPALPAEAYPLVLWAGGPVDRS